MSHLIRAMHKEDLPEVLHNEKNCYVYPWSEGIFKECLGLGHECWLSVFESNDASKTSTTAGHGVMSVAAGESHLLNVCVHPDWRNQGMGRVMVKHLLKRAQALQASTVFLEVRPSNLTACKLYETLGFNEVGIRPGYYPSITGREDAIVLAKELLDDYSGNQ